MKKRYMFSLKQILFSASALVIFSFSTSYAQQRNWLWANSGGGMAGANAAAVTTDASGNVYSAGTYNDSLVVGTTILTNPSNSEKCLFVAKYDASGKAIWAVSGTGDNSNYADAVAIDKDNNLYVTGFYRSTTLKIGTLTLTNSTAGKYDIFLVKFDKDGNVLWGKTWGGSQDDEPNTVKTDASGNVYIAGYYLSTSFKIGTLDLINANPGSPATKEMFVAKFDGSGTEAWAKSLGGMEGEYATAMTIDGSGNLFVTGSFRGTDFTLGSTTLLNDSLTTAEDFFLAKFDASGNIGWAVGGGGGQVDVTTAITTDASGNIYLTGTTTSGEFKIGSLKYGGRGAEDIFIAKYDASGSLTWSTTVGGTSKDISTGISVDASGNIFVSGHFNSTTISFGSLKLTEAGNYDAFVAKYTSAGTVSWVKMVGSEDDEKANGMWMDNSGYIYVAGQYYSPIVGFNNPPKVYSDGVTGEMYVAKMDNKEAAGINGKLYSASQFNIYPNPTTGLVNITNENILNTHYNLEVYNAYGAKVYSSLNDKKNILDMSNYPSGMYFMKIQNGNSIETKRIVKE